MLLRAALLGWMLYNLIHLIVLNVCVCFLKRKLILDVFLGRIKLNLPHWKLERERGKTRRPSNGTALKCQANYLRVKSLMKYIALSQMRGLAQARP